MIPPPPTLQGEVGVCSLLLQTVGEERIHPALSP